MQGQLVWKQEQAGTKQGKSGRKQGQAETARNTNPEKKKNPTYGRSLNLSMSQGRT